MDSEMSSPGIKWHNNTSQSIKQVKMTGMPRKQAIHVCHRKVGRELIINARLLPGLSTPAAARAIPIVSVCPGVGAVMVSAVIRPVCWVRVVGPAIISRVMVVSVVVPVFTSAATTAAKITVLARGLSKVITIERIFAVESLHFL